MNIKLSLLFNSILFVSTSIHAFSLNKVYEFFGANVHQEVIEKRIVLEKPAVLVIENINGNIDIVSESKQNVLSFVATKKANKEEQLVKITIDEIHALHDEKDYYSIKTTLSDKKSKASVDYSVVVPHGMKLQLSTQKGKITVNETHAPLAATTKQGNITITNADQTIKAESDYGSIQVAHATGNVSARTNYGNIIIDDTHKGIIAKTNRGKIVTTCTHIPETSRIQLQANSGNIILTVPQETNATIQGKTNRGTLVSDMYINLKAQTTQLNKKTWNRFKKEVDGIMGTGEAEIKLSSAKGNIKIKKALIKT